MVDGRVVTPGHCVLEGEVKARVMSVERGIGSQGDYLKIHSNA